MKLYCDTSFLLPLYLAEPGTATATAFLASAAVPVPLHPFGELELFNAVRLKVHRREVSDAKAEAVFAQVRADIMDGILLPVRLPAARHYRRAGELSRRHAAAIGCRTLDTLHVAAALLLGAEEFATFDHNQSRLAAAAGLTLRP